MNMLRRVLRDLRNDPLGPLWAGCIACIVALVGWYIIWELSPGVALISCLICMGISSVRRTGLRTGLDLGIAAAAMLTLILRTMEHISSRL
jgi:hypothetical protein